MSGGQITHVGAETGLRWAVSHKPKHRGGPSGDGYAIWKSGAEVFFAVSDGTGSGAEAADATEICLQTLTAGDAANLSEAFARSHAALKGSRGVALGMAIVNLDTDIMNWAAVGDIDGHLLRADATKNDATLIQNGGILGAMLPMLSVQTQRLCPGDLILLSSDGIRRNYRGRVVVQTTPQATADAIMANFSHASDDSIVMAISVEGAP